MNFFLAQPTNKFLRSASVTSRHYLVFIRAARTDGIVIFRKRLKVVWTVWQRPAWSLTIANYASEHITRHQLMNGLPRAAKSLRNVIDVDSRHEHSSCSVLQGGMISLFTGKIKTFLIMLLAKLKRFIYTYPITSVKVWCGEHEQQLLKGIFSDIGVPPEWLSIQINPHVHWFVDTIIMPPTSKKLREHIGFGLCVRPFVKNRAC